MISQYNSTWRPHDKNSGDSQIDFRPKPDFVRRDLAHCEAFPYGVSGRGALTTTAADGRGEGGAEISTPERQRPRGKAWPYFPEFRISGFVNLGALLVSGSISSAKIVRKPPRFDPL